MYKRILITALVFGMVSTGPPAYAAFCAPRKDVVDKLELQFNEKLTAGGLQNSQNLLEIWTSTISNTFTVLSTKANGISCIVSSGTHWFVEPPEVQMEKVSQ